MQFVLITEMHVVYVTSTDVDYHDYRAIFSNHKRGSSIALKVYML